MFARLMDFLLCLLNSLHLWSIKEPGIRTQIRWLFWGASLTSTPQPSSPLKSLPCLNCSSLGFIVLLCGEQSELGFGNTVIEDGSVFAWVWVCWAFIGCKRHVGTFGVILYMLNFNCGTLAHVTVKTYENMLNFIHQVKIKIAKRYFRHLQLVSYTCNQES